MGHCTKKPKTIKNTKSNISKLLTTPAGGIEKLLSSIQLSNMQRNIKINRGESNKLKYSFTANKSSTAILNKPYTTFVNYGKKGYEIVKTNTKKVMGNVKLTLTKIVKLTEYIMAATTPQWNMPYGSKFDKDVLAQAVSPQGSVSEENKQYQIDYQYLRYTE